jgi:hypothetical protein
MTPAGTVIANSARHTRKKATAAVHGWYYRFPNFRTSLPGDNNRATNRRSSLLARLGGDHMLKDPVVLGAIVAWAVVVAFLLTVLVVGVAISL